jgi:transposase-like protein
MAGGRTMPRRMTPTEQEREWLVKAVLSRKAIVTEISEAFGVSRETAYK